MNEEPVTPLAVDALLITGAEGAGAVSVSEKVREPEPPAFVAVSVTE